MQKEISGRATVFQLHIASKTNYLMVKITLDAYTFEELNELAREKAFRNVDNIDEVRGWTIGAVRTYIDDKQLLFTKDGLIIPTPDIKK